MLLAKITIYITVRNTLRTRSFVLLCLNHQCLHGPLSLFCHVSASPFSLLQQACFQLLMVVCTGDARPFALIFPCTRAPFWHAHLFAIHWIAVHWISRSLLARAPVRSSLNMNTYTPPQKNISHRIYTIHVGHLFWFQNGEFRRKVRDFHACVPSAICAPEYGIHWRQTGVTTENNAALYLVIVNYSKS